MSDNTAEDSYVVKYSDYTLLQYPPEAFYYGGHSNHPLPIEVTIDDVYQSFNSSGLYNTKIFQDVWL